MTTSRSDGASAAKDRRGTCPSDAGTGPSLDSPPGTTAAYVPGEWRCKCPGEHGRMRPDVRGCPRCGQPRPASAGFAKSYLTEPDSPLPRTGVWRRAPMDWAYRIEVEGYGSIAGVGFSTKAEAREAMRSAREEALSNG